MWLIESQTMRALFGIGAAAVLLIAWGLVHRSPRPPPPRLPPEATRNGGSATECKPRLPAPRLPFAPPTPEATLDSQPANSLLARLLNGEVPRLTREQVEPFLQKNGRSVESLLGAFEATGDHALLREALEKNPDDPRVNFAAFFSAEDYSHTEPASPERRLRLEALARSAPDNALAHYLLAFDDFKAGRTDAAVQQLLAAAQKSKFQDYSLDFIQNAEEAYRAAGRSEAEAKAAATFGLALPHLAELKQTGLRTIELAQLYRQNGDEESARASLQIGFGLGERLTQPGQLSLVHEAVGCAIQLRILEAMTPGSSIGSAGPLAQSQLDAIAQRRASIQEARSKAEAVLPTLAAPDLVNFCNRMNLLGEEAAVQWLLRSHAPQPSP